MLIFQRSCSTEGKAYPMNFKEFFDAATTETEMPADQVLKACLAILEKLAGLIGNQINLTSPAINFRTRTSLANTKEGGKPERPERKFVRMMISPKKTVHIDARRNIRHAYVQTRLHVIPPFQGSAMIWPSHY